MRTSLLCLILAVISQSSPAADPPAQKRLIEFGWDEPDTAFMRQHVAEMEQTPFDGCVFHLKGDSLWQSWGAKTYKESDPQIQSSLDDLKATPFKRLTHNFLRVNTTPAKIDWFDDHSAVINNCRLMAKVARDGKCKGILFDIEQYEGQLFDYSKQKDAKSKSWDVYAAQVRLRGKEVMDAFQEGYPGLTIFLTFGYSLPYAQSKGDLANLPKANYGLLAPFLDGMLDAAKDGTRIVDGHELSYSYKDTTRFAKAYQTMKTGVLPFVKADPKRYGETFSLGFGVWMDNNWRKTAWDTQDFSKNFYTPEAWENTLRTAWQTTDEYVWIYTETPRWWSAEGKTVKLPKPYEEATRRATGR